MKRLWSFLFVFALICVLAIGCGSDDDTTDGDTSDGDTTDGDTGDGDVQDGDVQDGDVQDGDVTDGDVTDGDVTDGDVTDGDVTDGDVTDGDVTDGDVTDGDVTDGDVTDGDVTDGDVEDPETVGWVSLYQFESYMEGRGTYKSVTASAFFQEWLQPDTGGEQIATVGDCMIMDYENTGPSDPNPGMNGGPIQITGAMVDPLDMTPYYDEEYGWMYSDNIGDGQQELFNAGDTLRIVGTGSDEFPAFDFTHEAVGPITGLMPDIFQADFSYTPGDPLSFSWDGVSRKTWETSRAFEFSISAWYTIDRQTSSGIGIYCSTDDDGSFTVPDEALAYLPEQWDSISLSVTRYSQTGSRVGVDAVGFSTNVSLSRYFMNY